MVYRHSKFPQESPIQRFPQESGIHLPSRKLTPHRVRTSLPSLIHRYSSQGLITGLSSANYHGRSPSAKFFLSPSEFIIVIPSGVYHYYPQRNPSLESSAGLSSKLQQSISATEQLPGRSSRIYFPRRKYIHKHFTFHTSGLHT